MRRASKWPCYSAFFFQAEDGIRDHCVTGVQTCALPISAEADERIDLFFAATRWQGEPVIGEAEKCSELRWASLDALPSTMVPYVRVALDQYRQHQPYAEFWPVADGISSG